MYGKSNPQQIAMINAYASQAKATIKRITKDGRIKIMAVPPEELLLDRRARSFEDSTIIAHRQMATVADLIAMGYDQDEIEENLSTTDLDSNDEYLARQPLSTTFGTNDAANPMMRRVLYIEAYSRVDFDGDGIAELRKVCCMGGGYKVVRNLPARRNSLDGHGDARTVAS